MGTMNNLTNTFDRLMKVWGNNENGNVKAKVLRKDGMDNNHFLDCCTTYFGSQMIIGEGDFLIFYGVFM